MPTGIELVLGWEYPEKNPIFEFPTELQLKAEEEVDDPIIFQKVFDWSIKNRKKLDLAQESGFAKLGFTKKQEKANYFFYKTPKGIQQFAKLQLDYYLNRSEMGEVAEMALLGISVTTRYFPTFVDWMDQLWNVKLEENKERKIIRECIVEQLPEFETASYYIKQRWY